MRAVSQVTVKSWRLIRDGFHSGAHNMSRDEAILVHHARGEVPPTIRIYGWDPPAVTIGYFQRMQGQVDPLGCRSLGFDAVRRPTGGRAVLHHREVTYSIIVSARYLPGSVEETYLAISRGLATGLSGLGLDVEMVQARKARPSSAACFEAPSSYELAIDGRKVVGSAQMRSQGVILQHGSVLLEFDPEELGQVLSFPSQVVRRRTTAMLADKAVGLNQVGSGVYSFDQVADALCQGLATSWNLVLTPGTLSQSEEDLAGQLCRTKYGSDSWNHKR